MPLGSPVHAHSEIHVFRTVAFICSAGANGTAVRTVENIRGERISYRITYLDGEATLFSISRVRHGGEFRQVKAIDLRGGVRNQELALALSLADEMEADAARYCQGGQRQIEAWYELLGNHEFNRTNSRYRGR